MSPCSASASAPSPRRSSTRPSSPTEGPRSTAAIWAAWPHARPSRARRRQVARPIPLAAPVTRTRTPAPSRSSGPGLERLQRDVERVQILRVALWAPRRLDDQPLLLGLRDRIQEEVVPIVLLSREVHLGNHHVEESAVHLEMDMGRPDPASGDRVGAGLDGLEGVDSVFVGHGLTEAEEVRVLRYRVRIGGVDIPALGVRLPNLDHGALDGPALLVGDPPRHVDDVALRSAGRTRDGGEVTIVRRRPRAVIAVQIEGTFFLRGRFLT